jgi:phage repressor protein C with HTH and peptisase S24 domain
VDSMSPVLNMGDTIIINRAENEISTPGIYVILKEKHYYLGRIQYVGEDRYYINFENTTYKSFETDLKDIQIGGKVVNYCRNI